MQGVWRSFCSLLIFEVIGAKKKSEYASTADSGPAIRHCLLLKFGLLPLPNDQAGLHKPLEIISYLLVCNAMAVRPGGGGISRWRSSQWRALLRGFDRRLGYAWIALLCVCKGIHLFNVYQSDLIYIDCILIKLTNSHFVLPTLPSSYIVLAKNLYGWGSLLSGADCVCSAGAPGCLMPSVVGISGLSSSGIWFVLAERLCPRGMV